MIDLSKPWPLGVTGRNWVQVGLAIAIVIFALYWIDGLASRSATSLSPEVVAFFSELTRWGESDWILIPSGALAVLIALVALVARRRRIRAGLIEGAQIVFFIFCAVGLPSLIVTILKRVIGRARPELIDSLGTLAFQTNITNYAQQSFPSGHSTTAMATAFTLSFISPRLFPLFLVFAIGIGMSRLVVGAHYPTDIVAGMALGVLGAYAVRYFFAGRRWAFEFKPDGRIDLRDPVALRTLFRRRRGSVRVPRTGRP